MVMVKGQTQVAAVRAALVVIDDAMDAAMVACVCGDRSNS